MTSHVYDPLGQAVRAAASTLAQDAHPRLTVLRGGGGVAGQVRPPLVAHIELNEADVRLLLQALTYPGVTPRLAAVGERIAGQLHPSLLEHAPAAGIPRPGAS